ncbi:uncharacterized protein LOC144920089 [Branchiostoma floridae x Branchiostoma belcheri]
MAELSLRARLYLKINDNLPEDDVRTLRATLVTDGHLGQARVETATPLEIFNMLEADNKIGQGNLALLVDLLKALGKTKLAQEAEDVAKREKTGGPSSTVEEVITCLKKQYAREHARIRPLPWCEDLKLPLGEVYTNLQHQRMDDKGHFRNTDTIVSLADIYKITEAKAKNVDAGSDVRRIRVEGDPGIGKSCSCQKLAHDWSSGKLEAFKAVFFLEIRHMSGKVKDAIFEQLLPEDTNMTPDQLWSYIQENQDDVLFILDGLDELSQTARENTDVVALIQGKILRNCHVLVTSRPYHCVKDLEKCHQFYRIIGYSRKDSVDFIKKYFSQNPESARMLEEQFESNLDLSRIVVNPLNNVLICIVWEDNDGRLPSSQAELYQMIVYSVAKRYCAKTGIPLEGVKIPPNIEEALRGLGKLSWEGLEQDQLQFDIADIREKFGPNADDMLDIGLLTRDNSFSRLKRTCFCAFLHKTFQEYLAAYYISELVKQESKPEEGRACLRSLFGMTEATASNVDLELMSTNRKRYREVQNMLLAILCVSSGPLFEMFAEELSKEGCKEKDKAVLSFVCITFLGISCGDGKMGCRIAEIVAPFLPQHIRNLPNRDMDLTRSFRDDSAAWIDGLIQVIRCQRILAMNHDPRLIHNLTFTFHSTFWPRSKQQLDMLEVALSYCDTISGVTLKTGTDADSVERIREWMSEGVVFSPIRTFVPRHGTESVEIDFATVTPPTGAMSVESMLEELSEQQNLQHIKITVMSKVCGTDFSRYDSLLANMVRKQRCLRSLSMRINMWYCRPEGSRGFGNLTATLQSISEHRTLEVVELIYPDRSYCNCLFPQSDEWHVVETYNASVMVHKLAEIVIKNKLLRRLRLSWDHPLGNVKSPAPQATGNGHNIPQVVKSHVKSPAPQATGNGHNIPQVVKSHVKPPAPQATGNGHNIPQVVKSHVKSPAPQATGNGHNIPQVVKSHVKSPAPQATGNGHNIPQVVKSHVKSPAPQATGNGHNIPQVVKSHVKSPAQQVTVHQQIQAVETVLLWLSDEAKSDLYHSPRQSIIERPITSKGICSRQSLSELCLAIQGNRTLKTLTIDRVFSESEGHQEIVNQLMRNKPANFEELRITMLSPTQHFQHIPTTSPLELLLRSDSISSVDNIRISDSSSTSDETGIKMLSPSEQHDQHISTTSPRCRTESINSVDNIRISDSSSIREEPGITMSHSEQHDQCISAGSPSCSNDSISEDRDDFRSCCSTKSDDTCTCSCILL